MPRNPWLLFCLEEVPSDKHNTRRAMDSAQPLIEQVHFDEQGLCPVIVQEEKSGQVLMLAYMNETALRETVGSGFMTYWSRSRQQLWRKGEQSGNRQRVRSVCVDCDGDTLLVVVHQEGGAACHTGHRSCFYRELEDDRLVDVGEQVFDPHEVYGEQ